MTASGDERCVYLGDEYLRFVGSGSRNWRHPKWIWDALTECLEHARAGGKILVVVHGDADGADQVFKLFGQVHDGALSEPHPADWNAPCRPTCKPGHRKTRKDGSEYCPAAGNYRNADMCEPGMWRAAVFIRRGSTGTTDCLNVIRRNGISPRVYRDND